MADVKVLNAPPDAIVSKRVKIQIIYVFTQAKNENHWLKVTFTFILQSPQKRKVVELDADSSSMGIELRQPTAQVWNRLQ